MYRRAIDGELIDVDSITAHLFGYTSSEDMLAALAEPGASFFVSPSVRQRIASDVRAGVIRPGFPTTVCYKARGHADIEFQVADTFTVVPDEGGAPSHLEGSFARLDNVSYSDGSSNVRAEMAVRHALDHSMTAVCVISNDSVIYANHRMAHLSAIPLDVLCDQFPVDHLFGPEVTAQVHMRRHDAPPPIHLALPETKIFQTALALPTEHSVVISSAPGPTSATIVSISMNEPRAFADGSGRSYPSDAQVPMNKMSPIGFLRATRNGRPILVSTHLASLLGFASAAAVCRDVIDVLDLFLCTPDRDAFSHQMKIGRTAVMSGVRIRRLEGSTFLADVYASIVIGGPGEDDYIDIVISDTSELHAELASLTRVAEKHKQMLSRSPWGICTIRAGIIVAANPALCALLGYDDSSAVNGRHLADIVAPEDLSIVDQLLAWSSIASPSLTLPCVTLLRADGISRVLVTLSAIQDVLPDANNADHTVFVTDITSQKRTERELRRRATHDDLTSLPSRNTFLQRLDLALSQHSDDDASRFVVLDVDIDDLALVNDSLGHSVGDVVLIEVARRLRDSIRPSDYLARSDGDRFVLYVPGVGMSDIPTIVARIHTSLEMPIVAGPHKISVSVTIGATTSSMASTSDELIRQADMALARAKKHETPDYEVFTSTMLDDVRRRLSLASELRLAFERESFTLHYQPIVAVDTQQVSSFEALLRWYHPERGVVCPANFLQVADEIGLLVPLCEWTIDRALADLALWRSAGGALRNVSVSVNIAHSQFHNVDLLGILRSALRRNCLSPFLLNLEITEEVFLNDIDDARCRLLSIRDEGVGVHLDDFGTGYSSLSYLCDLPFDVVKLDRAFLSSPSSRANQRLLAAIVSLAKQIGMGVVAEGLESPEQMSTLGSLGFDYAQGYFIGIPLE